MNHGQPVKRFARRARAGMLCALLLAGAPDLACGQETPLRPAHGEPPAPAAYARPELLVETAQLAAWIGKDPKNPAEPKLVVVDARPAEGFRSGHLPGAVNIESDPLQDTKRPPHYLPSPEALGALARAAGIDPDSRVVVYDAEGGRLAARVWLTIWASGHERVAILNGGLNKWRDEAREVTRDPPPAREGAWQPLQTPRNVLGLEDVARFRPHATPGEMPASTLLDARTYQEFMGADVRAKHGGHIPGAVNLPFDAFLEAVSPKQADPNSKEQPYHVWRSPQEIHGILRAACVRPGQPLAVYCQSGGRAAHLQFSLLLMGFADTANYMGSWREYGNRDDVDIEK